MIKKIVGLLCLWCLLTTHNAYAQKQVGQDLLAAQQKNFNVKAAILNIPQHQALGNLDHTFGDDLTNVKSLLTSIMPSFWRVHFINGPCIRGNNCGGYEYVHGYSVNSLSAAIEKRDSKILNPFKARVKEYCNLIPQFTGTKFIFSGILEGNASVKAQHVLDDAIRSVCPGVQLSHSVMGGVATDRYLGALIEQHGSTAGNLRTADIVSFDGAGASDADIPAFLNLTQNVKITYVWERQYNCRTQNPKWEDPRARKSCPSSKDFALLANILKPVPASVAFSGKNCKKISAFKSPFIWKPMAEDTGNGDPRHNLPVVLMLNLKGKSLNVLASNGAKIGTLAQYGGDQRPPTQTRYYSAWGNGSKLSGYEFEQASVKAAGNPWSWLQSVDGSCYGPLILGRRQGLTK